MHPTSHSFPQNARAGLANPILQQALGLARSGFPQRRAEAIARLPEFEELREQGRAIKDHVLAHLDFYLELYERNVIASGGQLHWARNAEEARAAVLDICRAANAKIVTKGKSMVAEEIALNDHLEANGITPVETDLGEYIIQLRHEPPSHIIAPAIHLMKEQVADAFRAAHEELDPARPLGDPRALCDEARTVLRPRFLGADVGITGANFLVAETGSSIIVTNEGNGDLTQILPRVHIVITGIEKVVPTLEDAATLLRLLARSATGQEFSSYTTISTGPRRAGDLDGPEEYHVVLLDNGRSALLGGEFQEMLRCLRCAACLNHCPVYAAVGGHAYGWVYPGPMGSVLTPALVGVREAGHLPNASTFCGRCESVCPVKIPLPKMMRHWREREFAQHLNPAVYRSGLRFWAWVARQPALYHALAGIASRVLGWAGLHRGRFRSLPLASGWTAVRDMPAPQGRTFHSLWAEQQRRAGKRAGAPS
ncbi:MAG: iron-sulfur cluster-binding protein [Alphaproteobacteria bacterium]|nr:iron-sulfur cluster-binding protein [Alphaproteobacteria bacterium]MBV9966586.1 iron-sulfur cluster-binding protein [Alphaproteobacteria bacterium]